MPTTAKARIHADKYEIMLFERGRTVKWQSASICSCWDPQSSQPNYNCVACNGKGFVYEPPVEAKVLLSSIVHNKEFQEMAGVFEVGDAVMTVPYRVPGFNSQSGQMDNTMANATTHPMYNIGMYDLVTVLDDEYRTSEVLVKGTPLYTRPADTLLNEDVVDIVRIRTYDIATGVQTEYVKDTDYTSTNNVINWVNGPADGAQYSVTYEHRPMFTVLTNLPTPRYQDGQLLPRKVALRYRAGGFGKA